MKNKGEYLIHPSATYLIDALKQEVINKVKKCKICKSQITYAKTDKKKKRVICRKVSCKKELQRRTFKRFALKNKDKIKKYMKEYYRMNNSPYVLD